MAFCKNCGTKLVDGAKFCQKCGSAIDGKVNTSNTERKTEYQGKLYKCPNCGEVLDSFVRNCPSCGLELRGAKATNSVKEFALKLEAIESKREYEQPKGFFATLLEDQNKISKTDEQKINLIQNFSVPNTKEDMLEFMILATSNINPDTYDSYSHSGISKGETGIRDAWNSKIKQVYQKAKSSYGDTKDFEQIKELYDQCFNEIKKEKRSGITKYILIFAVPFALLLLLCGIINLQSAIKGPGWEKEEVERLENIYEEAQTALENDEYKKALLNAEGLEYSTSLKTKNSDELERQWDVKRELLIDEILEEAEKDGVKLEYTPPADDENSEETN